MRPEAVLLCLTVVIFACAPPQGEEEPVVLETEDVDPGLDEEIDLTTDRKAAPRTSTSGRLPGRFPESLPVYKPSTISDMGQGETEDFVQFMSQDDAEVIRAWYLGALARAGWSVEQGTGGVLVVTHGQRHARISIETSGAVALVRIDF